MPDRARTSRGDAIARAHEILDGVASEDMDPYSNGSADAALRVLEPCDPEGLAEVLRERGREDLILE